MKVLLTILFFALATQVSGQTGLSIIYDHKPHPITNLRFSMRTIMADSAIFSYTYITGADPFYNNQRFGDSIVHHGEYFDRKLNKLFGYFNHPRRRIDPLLLEEDRAPIQWEITKQTKKILGYTCIKAIAKKPLRTIIWFAPELVRTGPLPHNYPGLPLEIYYPTNSGQRITAVHVQQGAYIVIRANYPVMPGGQFSKMVKDRSNSTDPVY